VIDQSTLDGHVDRVAETLRGQGRAAAAQALGRARDARQGRPPTIVVVGEDKRGKSSLVNALLATPDLSPVGTKVVTGSPLIFEYSTTPWARVRYYGREEAAEVDIAEAQRMATIEGNPANELNIREIRVGAVAELLRSAVLVDTPGVGGLESGHAELTLQSLAEADAMIFVVDASAPLREAELAFLRRATGRLQVVVFALSKTDVNPGWRTIQADDSALIAEHAPRFARAPICPVSSATALRAIATEDAEFIAEIRAESGIAALEQFLREQIAEELDAVRAQNVLRACITLLADLERELREREAAFAPDPAALDALTQERARLRAVREDKVALPARLEADVRKLTVARQDLCARRVLGIRIKYQEKVRNAKRGDFADLPGELQSELTAVAGELNEMAAVELSRILTGLLDEVDQQSVLNGVVAQLDGAAVLAELTPFTAGGGATRHGDRMAMLNSVAVGRSMISLVGGTSAAAFLAPPFGLVIGLGLGGLFAFHSWRDKDRRETAADFLAWMNEQITNAQLTINNGFAVRAVDLQSEMRAVIRRAVSDREAVLEQSVRQAQMLHNQDAAEQNRRREELKRRITSVVELRGQSARLLAKAAQCDACGASQRHRRAEGAYARSDGPELASGPEEQA
jgi:GTPase Era involved in 16S rRNA processing